jgi:hypothetical protein
MLGNGLAFIHWKNDGHGHDTVLATIAIDVPGCAHAHNPRPSDSENAMKELMPKESRGTERKLRLEKSQGPARVSAK